MASDRQIAANRLNANKNTGPRSLAGREASRRNALRHGLAVAVAADPSYHGEIRRLAKAIARSTGSQMVSEYAWEAAAAQYDLLRIRRIRAQLLNVLYAVADPAFDDLAELNDKLSGLERYERRAFSRRKRAFSVL